MKKSARTTRWIVTPTPSHLDDVRMLARMIAQAAGRSVPTAADMRTARERLAPRNAA